MKASKINKQESKQGVGVNNNLIPAVKGEPSPNPKGRPKKELCIPDILRRLLNEPVNDKTKVTALEAICGMAIFLAIGGDKDARAWIGNRLEGLPKQAIVIDAKVSQNISIEEKRKELENLTYEELLRKINESLPVN